MKKYLCPECEGDGYVEVKTDDVPEPVRQSCSTCQGEGMVE